MIPRTQEELVIALRALLSSKLEDLSKNLPIHLEWSSNEAMILIVSYFLYSNSNNMSKAARELGIARTTLAYYISKHPEIKKEIQDMINDDREYLYFLRRTRTRKNPRDF